jgi:hypothetical protein
MENQPILTREYLQGMVAMKKKELREQYIGQLVESILHRIRAAASTGATCYLYDSSGISSIEQQMQGQAQNTFRNNQQNLGINPYENRKVSVHPNSIIPAPLPAMLAPSPITNADLVEALKVKCPGCYVDYQEQWVNIEVGPGRETRELKKGIYIDWS